MAPFAGLIETIGGGRIRGLVERVSNRLGSEPLEVRVDRRVDPEAACPDAVRSVFLDQLVANVTEEERLSNLRVEASRPRITFEDAAFAYWAWVM